MINHLEIEKPRKGLFIYLNPFNYFYFRTTPEILNVAKYRMDGFFVNSFVTLVCGLKEVSIRQSFDMTSLAPKIFDYCINNKLPIFFAGGKDGDVEMFVQKILAIYPDLNVVGYCSGYHPDEVIISKIKASKSRVVVLGLGNIKQERTGLKLIKDYEALVFTCGAFISQTANSSANEGAYYPAWINKYQLRWLYRFYKEPHVIKRVAIYYPKFLFKFIIDWLAFKFK